MIGVPLGFFFLTVSCIPGLLVPEWSNGRPDRTRAKALSELPPLAGGGFQSRAGRRFAEARARRIGTIRVLFLCFTYFPRTATWRLSAIFVGVTTLPPGCCMSSRMFNKYKFCSILKREYEPKYEPVADLNHRNVGRVMGLTEDIHPNLVELRGNPEVLPKEVFPDERVDDFGGGNDCVHDEKKEEEEGPGETHERCARAREGSRAEGGCSRHMFQLLQEFRVELAARLEQGAYGLHHPRSAHTACAPAPTNAQRHLGREGCNGCKRDEKGYRIRNRGNEVSGISATCEPGHSANEWSPELILQCGRVEARGHWEDVEREENNRRNPRRAPSVVFSLPVFSHWPEVGQETSHSSTCMLNRCVGFGMWKVPVRSGVDSIAFSPELLFGGKRSGLRSSFPGR
ncbi:hypothetical protein FB451DRAFT_1170495 [Mycena latifolia]|nr:hypothetical protein FB451DRAFT_1170495 [Mycena latifolia]